MKWVVTAVIAIVFASTALFLLKSQRPTAISPAALPAAALRELDANGAQLERLSAQLDVLQRHLNAVESQVAARQVPAPGQGVADEHRPAQLPDVEQQRAQEAEAHHEYVATIAQAFARQRIDPVWANGAATRVDTVFGSDDALRNLSRNVECREQICRVEIEDDGTGRLNARMPFIAMGLADALPDIAAEHVDRGDGRGAMVLYLSRQPLVQAAGQGK